jgi:hypothetical protein
MLEDQLRFNLAAVIALADKTIAGTAHNSGRGDDPHGPALLLPVTGGSHDDGLVVLPLHRPDGSPLIDQLRTAAAHGHHILTLTLTDGRVSVGTGRRRHRTPLPAAA